MSEPLELRPEVAAFAQLMERALRENDYKGGWSDCTPDALLRRLREETDELVREIDGAKNLIWRDWDPAAHAAAPPQGDVIVRFRPGRGWFCASPHGGKRFEPGGGETDRIGEEAADVANFAMMIADVSGALK